MGGIRGASRFGQFFLIAVALLAGFGLVVLQRRFTRAATALAVVLLLGVHLEALRAHYLPPVRGDLADLRQPEGC